MKVELRCKMAISRSGNTCTIREGMLISEEDLRET